MTDEEIGEFIEALLNQPWGAEQGQRTRADRLLETIWDLRMCLVDEGWDIPVALRNYARMMGWKGHGAF